MTDVSSPALRFMGPRAVLLGPTDSLETIITNMLPDGALCWVTAEKEYFVLDRSSNVTADGVNIVDPAAGPGQWYSFSFLSSGEAATDQQALTALPVTVLAAASGEIFGASGIQVETTVPNQRLVVSYSVQRVNTVAGGGGAYQIQVDGANALGVITTTDPDTTATLAFRAGRTNVSSSVYQEAVIQIATPGTHEINVLLSADTGDETVDAGAILTVAR